MQYEEYCTLVSQSECRHFCVLAIAAFIVYHTQHYMVQGVNNKHTNKKLVLTLSFKGE